MLRVRKASNECWWGGAQFWHGRKRRRRTCLHVSCKAASNSQGPHVSLSNICKFWYKLTMDGWTETGRKIQSLSKPCPIPVQCTSKKRLCRGFVEALSRYSPSSVEPLSSSQTLGHTLDRQIQRLSKACPLQLKIVQFSTPDKLWTDFGLGK